MRTLIQKELREHGILALIALGVCAVLLIPAYQATAARAVSVARGTQWGTDALQPLMSSTLLTSTLLFCGLYGAILGWLQIRSESHRDLWAWLVHRPISRTRIFASKVVAGMVLYGVGAGVPLVVLVAVVRMPGNVAAPFEWPMVLPVFADFLGGITCYLAGLLTGLRQVRWYASRGLGLAAAVAVMIAVIGAAEFWQSLLFVVAGVVALGVATWGAFQGNGYDREQPVWGKVALVGTFVAGNLVVVMLAMAAVMALLPRSMDHFPQSETYMMGDDGNVYLRVSQGSREVEMLHPDRSPVVDPGTGRPAEIRLPSMWNYVVAEDRQVYRYSYRQIRRFFHPWKVRDGVVWYWTAEGRVVGYDVMTRRVMGRIEPSDSAERFLRPVDRGMVDVWETTQTILTKQAVYRVEPETRRLWVLYQAAEGDRIVAASGPHMNDNNAVVVVSERRIALVTDDGELVWNIAYEPGQPDYRLIQVYSLAEPGEYGVIIAPSYQANQRADWKLPYHAIWATASAGASRHVELPSLRLPQYQGSSQERVIGVVLPPILVVLLAQGPPQFVLDDALPSSLGGALVWVLIGRGIGRRRGVSAGRQAAWAGLHVVFGLPGLLASLSVRDWPVSELCPQCQRKRAIDEAVCRHCGAGFATPERNGTEIFEPLPGQPSESR